MISKNKLKKILLIVVEIIVLLAVLFGATSDEGTQIIQTIFNP